jgi:hypothetical protein
MEEEKKEEKKEEKSQEEDTSTNEDVKSEEQDKQEFDYEAELDRVKQVAQNYKEGMMSAKAKLKELKEQEEEEGETEENTQAQADLEDVIEELDKRAIKREQERIGQQAVAYIDDELSNLTDNKKEQELIKFYYENRINKSGSDKASVKEDLEMARLLANRKRLEKDNSALKEILINKQTTNSSPEFSGERLQTKKSNLSDADKAFISKINERRARRGLKPLKAEDIN